MKKTLLPVVLLSFVNGLGFFIMIPVLPFIVEKYGGTEITFGVLIALYSAAMFLGAPLFGSLSDMYGRKNILLLSHVGTFLSWGIFASAYFVPETMFGITQFPLWVIGFSRITDGITGGNNSVLNAYLADITTPAERSKAFGFIGAAMGLAIVLGPAIGGYSASFSIGFLGTAIIAAFISLLTLGAMSIWLKESLPEHHRSTEKKSWKRNLNLWKNIQEFRQNAFVQKVLKVDAVISFTMSLYTSIIPLYIIDMFHFNERTLSHFLLLVGGLWIFNQMVVLKWFVQKFGDYKTLFTGQILMVIGLIGTALIGNFWLYVCLYYFLNLGLTFCLSTLKSILSQNVDEKNQGKILGIDEGIKAFFSTFAPVLASWLYFQFGGTAFLIFAGITFVGLFLFPEKKKRV